MRKEIIETGKTVEEAIESACAKIGFDRDDVEWDIIDLPKKSFLGLKTIPAKVKVWKEVPDEKPVAVAAPKKEAPKPKVERPVEGKKAETAPTPKAAQDRPREKREVKILEMTPEIEKKAEAAKEYLAGVCKEMGMSPTFSMNLEDGGLCINVEGEGLGAMIGRRGETLDALQYLAGLVANRLEGEYLRITLDCGDYRTKRKATLEALAKKLSAQVLKTNTSKMLEPMNPFERRIIHASVSEIEGVSSSSVGEEPNRRVIITSPTARSRRPSSRSGSGRGDNRGGDRGGNRSGGDRGGDRRRRGAPPRREPRPSTQGGTINTLPQSINTPSTPAPSPAAPPKPTLETTAANDKPLYTKLDLE